MDYGLHEILELQEISAFKTICLTKSKTMKALVTDSMLKELLQGDIDSTTRHLKEYSVLLSKLNHELGGL